MSINLNVVEDSADALLLSLDGDDEERAALDDPAVMPQASQPTAKKPAVGGGGGKRKRLNSPHPMARYVAQGPGQWSWSSQ